eukprot:TRINITY_DN2670_c0_g4_i2.p1 TRINITY_DN2670_c0_g4~~TRINITY_DN2670_c0_g4_i2.p1  ORF type:complete len:242 (+),score=83.40 TRINITY_DN2670_c0_g4_i2:327-1052(+)
MKLLEHIKSIDSRITAKLATNSLNPAKRETTKPDPEAIVDAKIENASRSLQVYEKEVKKSRATLSPSLIRVKVEELEGRLARQKSERVGLEREVAVLSKKVAEAEKEIEAKRKLVEEDDFQKKEAEAHKLMDIEERRAEEYKQKMEEIAERSKLKEEKQEDLRQDVEISRLKLNNLKETAKQYEKLDDDEPNEECLRAQIKAANKTLSNMRRKYNAKRAKYDKETKKLKKKLQTLSRVNCL